MRKFLFSFMAVIAFTGLFGLQGALSQNCDPQGNGGPFNCSGGVFWGLQSEVTCWISQLKDGVCGLSDCGTVWHFFDIETGWYRWYQSTENCLQ
jgi:hypothetical protein